MTWELKLRVIRSSSVIDPFKRVNINYFFMEGIDMSILKGLGRKLVETGQGAAQQANIFAEVTKIKSHISDEEDKINDTYKRIGKAYYESHKDDPSNVFATEFADITASLAKIEQLSQQIRDVKGVSVCLSCGAEVAKGAEFCSACGAAVIQQRAVTEEVVTDAEN